MFDHGDFLLFALHADDGAVVIHANEQASAARVGEGDDFPRDFLGGSEFPFELYGTIFAVANLV